MKISKDGNVQLSYKYDHLFLFDVKNRFLFHSIFRTDDERFPSSAIWFMKVILQQNLTAITKLKWETSWQIIFCKNGRSEISSLLTFLMLWTSLILLSQHRKVKYGYWTRLEIIVSKDENQFHYGQCMSLLYHFIFPLQD